jgi:hypothetical protein
MAGQDRCTTTEVRDGTLGDKSLPAKRIEEEFLQWW